MMIVLRTQYRENYGTPEAPYWKNKGGSEYKITNVPTSLSEQEMLEVVDKICSTHSLPIPILGANNTSWIGRWRTKVI